MDFLITMGYFVVHCDGLETAVDFCWTRSRQMESHGRLWCRERTAFFARSWLSSPWKNKCPCFIQSVSLSLSIYLSIYLSFFLSFFLSYRSIYPILSIHPSSYLAICWSIYICVWIYIKIHTHIYIYICIHFFIAYGYYWICSVYLYIYIYMYVCMCVTLCFMVYVQIWHKIFSIHTFMCVISCISLYIVCIMQMQAWDAKHEEIQYWTKPRFSLGSVCCDGEKRLTSRPMLLWLRPASTQFQRKWADVATFATCLSSVLLGKGWVWT